jgi:peptidoglycan/xylan/chitin deacetylase (PgdA/CDA1 family)
MLQDLSQKLIINNNTLVNKNRLLTWEDIKLMQLNNISLGSHTQTHIFFNDSVSEIDIRDEMLLSKLEIENEIKTRVRAFSYPGGKFSEKTMKVTQEIGYDCVCTCEPGVNTLYENLFALKRINYWDGTANGLTGKFFKSICALQLIRNSLSVWRNYL